MRHLPLWSKPTVFSNDVNFPFYNTHTHTHLHPNPKVISLPWYDFVWCADRNWSLSPFSDAAVPLKVNSRFNKLLFYTSEAHSCFTCVLTHSVCSAHSLGSTKSLGVCCPLPRTLTLLCTGWGSSPPTTLWPSPASGTLSPSWGRWRRPPERSSTVAWYVWVLIESNEWQNRTSF